MYLLSASIATSFFLISIYISFLIWFSHPAIERRRLLLQPGSNKRLISASWHFTHIECIWTVLLIRVFAWDPDPMSRLRIKFFLWQARIRFGFKPLPVRLDPYHRFRIWILNQITKKSQIIFMRLDPDPNLNRTVSGSGTKFFKIKVRIPMSPMSWARTFHYSFHIPKYHQLWIWNQIPHRSTIGFLSWPQLGQDPDPQLQRPGSNTMGWTEKNTNSIAQHKKIIL